MVTLNLYTLEERKPKHDQLIVYVHNTSSFGYGLLEFQECRVECVWLCLDEDGWVNGNEIIFEENAPEPENARLVYLLNNGSAMEDYTLWCDAEEFYRAICGEKNA